jgi:hypothetical protein
MPETMVPANGIEVCAETFGERDAPVLLLIAAARARGNSVSDLEAS